MAAPEASKAFQATICAREGCSSPLPHNGRQHGSPRRYCSARCRRLAWGQTRSLVAGVTMLPEHVRERSFHQSTRAPASARDASARSVAAGLAASELETRPAALCRPGVTDGAGHARCPD